MTFNAFVYLDKLQLGKTLQLRLVNANMSITRIFFKSEETLLEKYTASFLRRLLYLDFY